MSDPFIDRPPATTIEAVDLHLRYVQGQLSELVRAIPQMATKADIDGLRNDLKGYATKQELTDLENRLSQGTVEGTFKRLMKTAVFLAGGLAAMGALWLVAVEVVHSFDAWKQIRNSK